MITDNNSLNNNNNNHSLNNNTTKYHEKSTQTVITPVVVTEEATKLKESEEPSNEQEPSPSENLVSLDTKSTQTTNLHTGSICCLNSIPYADQFDDVLQKSNKNVNCDNL